MICIFLKKSFKKWIVIVAQVKIVQVICMPSHWLNMFWTTTTHYFSGGIWIYWNTLVLWMMKWRIKNCLFQRKCQDLSTLCLEKSIIKHLYKLFNIVYLWTIYWKRDMLLSYQMNKNYPWQLMLLLSFVASLTHNAAWSLLHLQKLNIHMIHHTTLHPWTVNIKV